MSDNRPLLLKNAAIYQGKNLVLSGVNLELRAGDFAYLIGETGSGKSSLLRTLYADLPLQGGEGSVVGVVLGATLLRVLQNLVTLLHIPSSLEFAVTGAVIMAGVLTDEILRRRRKA